MRISDLIVKLLTTEDCSCNKITDLQRACLIRIETQVPLCTCYLPIRVENFYLPIRVETHDYHVGAGDADGNNAGDE